MAADVVEKAHERGSYSGGVLEGVSTTPKKRIWRSF